MFGCSRGSCPCRSVFALSQSFCQHSFPLRSGRNRPRKNVLLKRTAKTLRKSWSFVCPNGIALGLDVAYASVALKRRLNASGDIHLTPLFSQQLLAISLPTGSARHCGFRSRPPNFGFLASPQTGGSARLLSAFCPTVVAAGC